MVKSYDLSGEITKMDKRVFFVAWQRLYEVKRSAKAMEVEDEVETAPEDQKEEAGTAPPMPAKKMEMVPVQWCKQRRRQ